MERRVTEEIIFAIKRRSKAQFLPPQDWVLISISDEFDEISPLTLLFLKIFDKELKILETSFFVHKTNVGDKFLFNFSEKLWQNEHFRKEK